MLTIWANFLANQYKVFKKIFFYSFKIYQESIEWGYKKRYFYHVDSIEKQETSMYVFLHARGSRSGCKISIQSLIKENIICEIHPIDSFFIGMLYTSTHEKIIDFIKKRYVEYKNNYINLTSVKLDTLLFAQKIWINEEEKILFLLNKNSIFNEIDLMDIASHPSLITGLGSEAAFKIGQDISNKLLENLL